MRFHPVPVNAYCVPCGLDAVPVDIVVPCDVDTIRIAPIHSPHSNYGVPHLGIEGACTVEGTREIQLAPFIGSMLLGTFSSDLPMQIRRLEKGQTIRFYLSNREACSHRISFMVWFSDSRDEGR